MTPSETRSARARRSIPDRRTLGRGAFGTVHLVLSLVPLAVTGLFMRSLRRTVAIDPGFGAQGVAHSRVALPLHGYDDERARALFARLTERVRSRPEVASAAFASNAPRTGSTSTSDAKRPGKRDGETVNVPWSAADVGFVELLFVLALEAELASIVPARRAAAADPMVALRAE